MAKKIDTIGDQKMADLQRRAQKANPQMFSREAVRQRLASQKQQAKANQS
jgi:hypothetical protein